MRNRTLLIIGIALLVGWCLLRPGGMSTARLYGTGAMPVPGGLYGGGQ